MKTKGILTVFARKMYAISSAPSSPISTLLENSANNYNKLSFIFKGLK